LLGQIQQLHGRAHQQPNKMNSRLIGFDLARAYAIFGMFIVNFVFCFGDFQDKRPLGFLLTSFVGNSTSIFIILAGMGVSLMTNRTDYTSEEKKKLKSVILKRSWFLFVMGLLLYNWWPADILHFYGGYMHIAAFLIFVPKRYYLWVALLAIIGFHLLLFVTPVKTSWDFTTYKYADFWTPLGFLRNTFYNGWNAIFPWLSYFMLGMWLGRYDWKNKAVIRNTFLVGLAIFAIFEGLRMFVRNNEPYWKYWDYIMSDYFPAYIPYIMITTGFAFMVISVCIFIGNQLPANKFINLLAKTGQMTLSHYVIHLTLGMVVLSVLSGKPYTGYLVQETPVSPTYILTYAISFFLLSVVFSHFWRKRFKNGPLEMLMRKISG
jgi:uncharacterized protein